ncbi:MAG: anaerobic ribonucleoside-triphosphate reductase activating protein [Elusimicrobia bacterium]|nr:anaerobic ribonucleoside-triphosphate reductase activating protein [Elusimicrobiota bacterium]
MNSELFIADYLETSLLDWEGKISCVLFLAGCNFRCPWCQNRKLVLEETKNQIPIKEILEKFKSKKNWIDGFVITGGEPTINRNLKKIISQIKDNNFLVKLDTNGSKFEVIKELISDGLVDSIAMDIKTSLEKEKYNKACGVEVNLSDINHTIEVLLNSNIDILFRTTAVSGIVDTDDIKKIIKIVKGKKYIVQKFVPRNTLDKNYADVKPYSEQDMKKMEEMCYAELF